MVGIEVFFQKQPVLPKDMVLFRKDLIELSNWETVLFNTC